MDRISNYKQVPAPAPASSSFTADLFGPNDSSKSSSATFFADIFPPPTSTVPRKDEFANGNIAKHEAPTYCKAKAIKKESSSVEPCYYNSSIYYGAQQVYSPNNMKKDEEKNESNSGCASRGNWWEGSVYY